MRGVTLAAATATALVCAAFASTARADTPVLPADAALPWSSPTHQSPLEQILDPVVSQIVGSSASVRCEGDYDWGLLSAEKNIPAGVWGYVEFLGGKPIGFAELSPRTCNYLQAFAQASTKPTKCTTVTQVPVQRPVTKTVKVRVQVKVKKKWVWKTVTRTVHTTETVLERRESEPTPCYSATGERLSQPGAYWSAYDDYAFALLTVAHESFHIQGDMDESTVNCHGIQRIALIAQALGAAPDDAEQIARYALNYVVAEQPQQYQLDAECRDGGALDLNPASTVWP